MYLNSTLTVKITVIILKIMKWQSLFLDLLV